MKTINIKNIIQKNSKNTNKEFKRLFHGRGSIYDNYKFLTIDSIGKILNVAFYFDILQKEEDEVLQMLKDFIKNSQHNTILLQRRYIKNAKIEIIMGNMPKDIFAIENEMKIKLNIGSNQNNGFFPDMKNGRSFIEKNAKDKNVLNLFSYTCTFSLFALRGGAKSVSNIDMAKNALTTGRSNHHLNNLSIKNVFFFPYNILKSFSRIKKKAPYDLIIIDPPSFQKGSFDVAKDYEKIIKKLELISSPNCIILACLNSNDLNSSFLIEKFKLFAPSFVFIKRLENVKEFISKDEEMSLKNMIFAREKPMITL